MNDEKKRSFGDDRRRGNGNGQRRFERDGERRSFGGGQRHTAGDGRRQPAGDGKRRDDAGRSRPVRGTQERNRSYRSDFRGGSSVPVRKGPGARDVALSAYRLVTREGAYASEALNRALEKATLSSEDRRFAASLFYTTLEKKLYLEWVLDRKLQTRPEAMVWDILTVAAAQLLAMGGVEDYAAVNEAVEQTRRRGMEGLTGLVNGTLKGVISLRDAGEADMPSGDTAESVSVRCSVSLPIAEALLEAYGLEQTERMLAFKQETDTVCVRPNLMNTTTADFEAWLERKGYTSQRGTVPETYRVRGAGQIAALPEYGSGMFSIQSESSVLAAMAVRVRPGEHILDACAAPGGKTCWMAEHMMNTGRVYAWDLHDHRVALLKAAAKRLGLDNVRPMAHDARDIAESMQGTMDAVLVDAPCSGLGVMGDKPDIRYRMKREDFAALAGIQEKILDSCAECVRPGGRLIYSTCTVLPEENELQIRAFLERHPEFEADTATDWLPESLRPEAHDGMLQLLPNINASEGFFIARLRRR